MQNFAVVVHTVSMICAVILLFSYMFRKKNEQTRHFVLMGVTCGLGATISMLDPIVIQQGVQVDGRNLFIGLAAVVGGYIGVAIAAAVAVVARVLIGGAGVFVGIIAILSCAVIGVIWVYLDKLGYFSKKRRWLYLGGMLSLSIPILLMLPAPIGARAFAVGGPYLALIYVCGALVIGFLLDKEYRFVSLYNDVSRDAETDPLTGALNRRGLARAFEARIMTDREPSCLIITLDVDQFKAINDQFGHDVGDQALMEVVAQIKSVTRYNDLIARTGGDEFIICAFDVEKQQVDNIISKIAEKAEFELKIDTADKDVIERSIDVKASIGSTFYQGVNPELDQLIRIADQKMMDVKRKTKASSVGFETQATQSG